MLVNWPGPSPSLPSERQGGPARLYLVEPGRGVPEVSGCLEDWVVLPASDQEISARTDALIRRLRVHRDIGGASRQPGPGPRDAAAGGGAPARGNRRGRGGARSGARPRLDSVGVLHSGDSWVDLPPLEARLMGVLLAEFGRAVPTEALLSGGWGGSRPGTGALRVHILRLRRRTAVLGLAIHTLPGRGYLLSWAEP